MSVKFIGCLHLQHQSIARMRGFDHFNDHDEHLIKSWNSVVDKRDKVYILGDVTMESHKPYYQLDRLNGLKVVVLGNHDREQDVRELLKYVHNVAGMVDYKGFALTHAPIHPSEIGFYRGNIHAHIHQNKLQEVFCMSRYNDPDSKETETLSKYYCVDAQLINYLPKTIDELIG